MSAETKEVYSAICAVMADLSVMGIGKDRKNQQSGYNFRGIDDVYDTLSPLLAKHGLVILPRITDRVQLERVSKSGGAIYYTTVTAEFDFVSIKDGSIHTVRTYGESMDSSDKSTNKAMSAAYKYACFQSFCIPVEGEDADATTPEAKPAKPAPMDPKTPLKAPLPPPAQPADVADFPPVSDEKPKATPPPPPPPRKGKAISTAQQQNIFCFSRGAGWADDEVKAYLEGEFHVTSTADIQVADYNTIVDYIKTHKGYAPKEG